MDEYEVLPPGPLRLPINEPLPEWIEQLPEWKINEFSIYAAREIAEHNWRYSRWFDAAMLWGPDAAGPRP